MWADILLDNRDNVLRCAESFESELRALAQSAQDRDGVGHRRLPGLRLLRGRAGEECAGEVGRHAGPDYDTHHIMLDFGAMPFPVLEGQSIGVVPPGVDELGRPHHPRQYSVASARNGERPGYNNVALTVKRRASAP